MATFLIKTEPGTYSYDDLAREGRTTWTGVSNPAAQKHMRSIKPGDRCLVYLTGGEKRIAGLAKVVRGAYPDPDRPGLTAAGEPKAVLFDIEPANAASAACTLADIKADPRFDGFALVREPRLSVMPVPAAMAKAIKAMAGL